MNFDHELLEELATVFVDAAVRELEKRMPAVSSGYSGDISTNEGGSIDDVRERTRPVWPKSAKHRD